MHTGFTARPKHWNWSISNLSANEISQVSSLWDPEEQKVLVKVIRVVQVIRLVRTPSLHLSALEIETKAKYKAECGDLVLDNFRDSTM